MNEIHNILVESTLHCLIQHVVELLDQEFALLAALLKFTVCNQSL